MVTVEFLLTSLVVVLVPGTGVIYTVSTGIFRGWRASLAAALGCTAGIIPHLLSTVLGLSALLHLSALAFQTVKMAGAAYLLCLAWSMWRNTGVFQPDAQDTRGRAGRIIVRGFLINILNPKLSIFFLSFLPLFVAPGATAPMLRMFMLSGVFMLMTLVIFMAYGICADRVRAWVTKSPRTLLRLQRSFAMIFGILGVKLALTD